MQLLISDSTCLGLSDTSAGQSLFGQVVQLCFFGFRQINLEAIAYQALEGLGDGAPKL